VFVPQTVAGYAQGLVRDAEFCHDVVDTAQILFQRAPWVAQMIIRTARNSTSPGKRKTLALGVNRQVAASAPFVPS
jgi:hypothetical protein